MNYPTENIDLTRTPLLASLGTRAALTALCALVVLAALGLWYLFDDGFVSYDTAQYLSVAENLLAGRGASSSLIYFEQHYALGGVPVPQTAFPVGFSVMIAAVSLAGVPIETSAFAAALLAYCLVPLLLWFVVRRAGFSPAIGLLAATSWFAFTAIWFNVLLGKSETAFVLATLASLACIVAGEGSARRRLVWFIAAGVFAAASFSVRYQAVAFLASFGLYFLIRALRRKDAGSVLDLVVVCTIPAACVVYIALRNLALVGTFTGSAVASVDQGLSVLGVLHSFYWALSTLTGFSAAGLMQGRVAEIGLALVAPVIAVLLARAALAPERVAVPRSDPSPWMIVPLLYVGTTVLLLAYLGWAKSGGYVNDRYLIALIPFVLLLLPGALCRLAPARGGRSVPLSVAALCVVLGLGQMNVFQQHRERLVVNSDYRAVRAVLAQAYGEETLSNFLRRETSAASPLLALHGPLVGAATGRPVLAIPRSLLTHTTWSVAHTHEVIERYNVRYVLLFPGLVDIDAPQFSTHVLFRDLLAGRVPAWLQTLHAGERYALYRVRE